MATVSFAETRTWVGSGTGRCNEDYALLDAEHSCAMLVDGATGLTKANLIDGETDASWYARKLCQAAMSRMRAPDISTQDALACAGAEVAETYLSLPGARELLQEDLPNGSLAVLRWQRDEVEVTMLGDCTAVVELRNGTAHVIHDGTLDALDQANYERMFSHATKCGTTMAEARRALNPHFIANRLRMNEPDGYWAADISCRGFGHELRERFPLCDVAGVFACSDGFAAAAGMGIVADMGELAAHVLAGEGEGMGRSLRAAERTDADCLRVHRSKTSDDATYVAVTLA